MAGMIEDIARRMGYRRHRNTAYGRTNGIFLNVSASEDGGFALLGGSGAKRARSSRSYMPVVRAFVRREGGVDLEGINAFLSREWQGLKVYPAQADETSVWLYINSLWAVKAEHVEPLLRGFSEYLAQNGCRSEGCCLCGAKAGLGFTARDGYVMEACGACHARLEKKAAGAAERGAAGSDARGAAGAVLGGIMGLVPWALLGALGYIAVLSGFIMAWLSHKGYTLAGGRRGRGMVWTLAAVLFVLTYVGMALVLCVNLMAEGYAFSGSLLGVALAMPFTWAEGAGYIWAQLALGWLFAALGLWWVLRRASREDSGKDIGVTRVGEKK